MPDQTWDGDSRPSSTSRAAPATAQIHSGQANGRAITPAVASAVMPQTVQTEAGNGAISGPAYRLDSNGMGPP